MIKFTTKYAQSAVLHISYIISISLSRMIFFSDPIRKISRTNNFFKIYRPSHQTILVPIALLQKRFESDLELRNQTIVSAIKFEKKIVYDTDSPVKFKQLRFHWLE